MTSADPYDYPDYRDEFGQVGPLPASDGQRQAPDEGFYTGPEIGMPLPGFTLWSASGSKAGTKIDLHADRGDSKAAVVFEIPSALPRRGARAGDAVQCAEATIRRRRTA